MLCLRPHLLRASLQILRFLHRIELRRDLDRQPAAVRENMVQNTGELRAPLMSDHRIFQPDLHEIFLRKTDFRRPEQVCQKDILFLQLVQNARTVYLQHFLRIILSGKAEFLCDLHRKRSIRKKLAMDFPLQLIDIFFVNPLRALQINVQNTALPVICSLSHHRKLQIFLKLPLELQIWKSLCQLSALRRFRICRTSC